MHYAFTAKYPRVCVHIQFVNIAQLSVQHGFVAWINAHRVAKLRTSICKQAESRISEACSQIGTIFKLSGYLRETGVGVGGGRDGFESPNFELYGSNH